MITPVYREAEVFQIAQEFTEDGGGENRDLLKVEPLYCLGGLISIQIL